MPENYFIANSEEARKRYEQSKKLELEGLKPFLNPPFVNLPPVEITDSYKQNILLDNNIINNIKYMSLKQGKSIGGHWHKENFHYILLMKGSLTYYEKPLSHAKGVYVDRIQIGNMFYIPALTEHEIIAEENESQFYVFSHKSTEEESRDTFKSNYDIKIFPLISRPETGPTEYIKRF